MQLGRLLGGLTERMGWGPTPPKGDDGRHVLEFDDGLLVACEETPGRGILLTALVTELPRDETRSEALLHRLLKLTLPRMTTQQAVLSLDSQTGNILLHRRLNKDADLNAFQEALEMFLNNLDFWRKNSKADSAPASAAPFPFLYP